MSLETWLLFVVTVLTLTSSPGPMTLLSMSHGVRYGWRRSLASALGGMLSTLMLMCLSAAGLGLILATSNLAFQVIKWCGAAYLVYLGIKMWRLSDDTQLSETNSPSLKPFQGSGKLFLEMFYAGISNPNALLFFSALFPQFVNQTEALPPQLLLLALTFSILEFSFLMAYAYGASRIAAWLKNSGSLKWFNRLTGSLFISAGVVLVNIEK